MGGGLLNGGLFDVRRAALFSKLVVMSSCLDEGKSCSGVGPGGRLVSVDSIMVCYLWAMGVDRESWVAEVCVIICWCSGDSARRSFRK